MPFNGRGRSGRGRGFRGSVGGMRSDWESPGRGRGGKGGYRDGHDDRVRHVAKSDHMLKSRRDGPPSRGRGRGKGRGKGKGKGKGKGDNLYLPPALRHGGAGGIDRVCRDFARHGDCPRGNQCNWLHVRAEQNATDKAEEENIHRHCEVVKAHETAIVAIAMEPQGIYTASQDKTIKRWKPQKDETGRFQLLNDLKVELQESCHSMYCSGGWIFCGLWDGSVKAYSQDGANSILRGHTKRITAIIQHQGVLITGSADREVRLWQMDPGTKAFNCTHTLHESMPGAISCLHVLGDCLWVGGMSGIAICNLATLKVIKILPPVKNVAKFMEFQGHVIAAYAEGSLRIFDVEGTQKSETPALAAGPIVSIAGLEVGPRLLIGHAHGQVSTIILPDFIFRTQFQASVGGGCSIESVLCPGQDGLFLVGSKSGNLQLWQKLS